MGVLSGLRVLDLSGKTGVLCSRLLSGMGSEVVRCESEEPGLRGRVASADVFMESFPPGYLSSLGLDYKELGKVNPRLIMVSITPFGQSGPYKDYKASDLTLQALGGWMSVTGGPGAPLKLSGNQAYHIASLFAVNGILLALRQRSGNGRGQYLDISIFECAAASLDHVLPRYFYGGVASGRQGSLHWNNAFRVFPCKDGFIHLSLHRDWDTLVEWLASEGMAEGLTDTKWRDRAERDRNIFHIIGVLEKWTSTHRVEELVEKGQLMHFPWAEVRT
jgi:crotonobetainyl-CoA:carnitine CoA-transferase CaiB-like acyl-CoA transferase